MAACSAASDATVGGPSPGAEAGPRTSSGALADAVAAVVAEASNPVPSASADTPPDVATEACTANGSAEHLYPGLLVADLAHVVALIPSVGGGVPSGYTRMPSPKIWIKDGAVTSYCNGLPDTVIFVR